MLHKLESLEERYQELTDLLSKPEIIADQSKFQQYAKTHSDLTPLIANYQEYKAVRQELEQTRQMLAEQPEEEFKAMVLEEIQELEDKARTLNQALTVLLLPRDPDDDKGVIMEIRAGTGGEEAALFASDLFRMYSRYAEYQGWKTEIIDISHTDIGGIKEVVFGVAGQGVYRKLKFESGVHRVQRIPSTESGGRIHTSAATVAVLPEAEDVEVDIDPNDLRIDVFCSSGPGGQSVNTTQSAVRITHTPSGISVSCQDEKSQHKNKAKALRVLRARLKEVMEAEKNAETAGARKSQVGSGDRS